MLGYINVRLQEATQNYNAPVGGIALVMLDDFDQLPPVVGSSIPEVAMRMLQEKNLWQKLWTVFSRRKQ